MIDDVSELQPTRQPGRKRTASGYKQRLLVLTG